jgi:hypothetical protein
MVSRINGFSGGYAMPASVSNSPYKPYNQNNDSIFPTAGNTAAASSSSSFWNTKDPNFWSPENIALTAKMAKMISDTGFQPNKSNDTGLDTNNKKTANNYDNQAYLENKYKNDPDFQKYQKSHPLYTEAEALRRYSDSQNSNYNNPYSSYNSSNDSNASFDSPTGGIKYFAYA